MRYEDEWSEPKDGVDDFSVPKEARSKIPKSEKYQRPSSRILNLFEDRWMKSREKQVMLSLPWSTKMIFQKNVGDLLEKHSEAEVTAMVNLFFDWGVDTHGLTLKNDDLWKDFWFNRAKLYNMVQRDAPVVAAPASVVFPT